MRFISGCLLAMLSLPCGSATGPAPDMADLAGVAIRIFDLAAPDVGDTFREFMATVPMTNDRHVPDALVEDTLAALSFAQAATPPGDPAYFVAAYINKTPLVATPATEQARYLERYGEPVYPQQVCPVFVSRSDDLPQMLSAATNLPRAWFAGVEGSSETYNRLFALTEASHCGFIARELVQPTVLPAQLEPADLRAILEALGDLEATAVSRSAGHDEAYADSADVLFAARLLAMFVAEREDPYTVLPALILEYRRIGIAEANRQLAAIRHSVQLARRALHEAWPARGEPASWRTLGEALHAVRTDAALEAEDPLAAQLVSALAPAMRLLRGDRSVRVFPVPVTGDAAHLITFAGSDGDRM